MSVTDRGYLKPPMICPQPSPPKVSTRTLQSGHTRGYADPIKKATQRQAQMLTATNDKARVHPASPNRNVTVRDGTMAHVTCV